MDYLTENVDLVIYKDEPLDPVEGGKKIHVFIFENHTRNTQIYRAEKF